VLKIPFLHAVFPDSKFIHVFRDGRMTSAVRVRSDSQNQAFELRNVNARQRMLRQWRQMCWWEIPAYLPRFTDALMRRYLMKKPVTWQGLRYEGWRDDRRRLSPYELQVKQWRVSVETALASLERLPAGTSMNVRFEDFIKEPGKWLHDIAQFAGLEHDESALQQAARAVHDRSASEPSPSPPAGSRLEAALPLAEPLLRRLGYL
jgi:hypothetical protein